MGTVEPSKDLRTSGSSFFPIKPFTSDHGNVSSDQSLATFSLLCDANGNGNSYCNRNTYTNGNSYCNCNPNTHRYCNSNTYTNGNTDCNCNPNTHRYRNCNTYTNGNADRNTGSDGDGDAYVPARGHTWAVEHGCTRTECSISLWWNDRWNVLLRVRWPNLHRRLP